jgi:hypothetical protein
LLTQVLADGKGIFARKRLKGLSRAKGEPQVRGSQSGMANKWLSKQGLISVKEQWVRIHYAAKAR